MKTLRRILSLLLVLVLLSAVLVPRLTPPAQAAVVIDDLAIVGIIAILASMGISVLGSQVNASTVIGTFRNVLANFNESLDNAVRVLSPGVLAFSPSAYSAAKYIAENYFGTTPAAGTTVDMVVADYRLRPDDRSFFMSNGRASVYLSYGDDVSFANGSVWKFVPEARNQYAPYYSAYVNLVTNHEILVPKGDYFGMQFNISIGSADRIKVNIPDEHISMDSPIFAYNDNNKLLSSNGFASYGMKEIVDNMNIAKSNLSFYRGDVAVDLRAEQNVSIPAAIPETSVSGTVSGTESFSNSDQAVQSIVGNVVAAQPITTIINNYESPDIPIGDITNSLDGIASGIADINTGIGVANDTLTDIQVGIGAIGEAVTDSNIALDGIADSVQDLTDSLNPAYDASRDYKVTNLTEVFPFCIPFDIYYLLNTFKTPAGGYTAMTFDWTFPFPEMIGGPQTVTINLSSWNNAVNAIRRVEVIVYCIGLAFATRKLIKW